MQLNFEQIQKLIHGAASVMRKDNCICMCRFTEEQEKLIEAYHEAYYARARTTAGITLEMETDSQTLTLSVEVSNAFRESRKFNHSVLVNGKRIGQLHGSVPEDVQAVSMEAQFDLGDGYKRVQIAFPWSANSAIRFIEVDDGATVQPVRKQRNMLIFGDSITQGYSTVYPENAYAQRLAQYLDASAINKAIGGIKYYPPLAKLADPEQPDIILVSFGGNDFHGGDKEAFERDSVSFCQSLRCLYPDAKMIVLMPLCTGVREKNEPNWYFRELQSHLRGLSERFENLTVIESSDFVPDDMALFHSDRHPLDEGHDWHFRGIKDALNR